MSQDPARRFLFVSCQVGAEPALKDEIAREYPELRFAFSRPGFVTFKSPQELEPDFSLRSVFARAFGLSLGESREADSRARAEAGARLSRAVSGGEPLLLHAWQREPARSAGSRCEAENYEEQEESEVMALAPLAEVALRDAGANLFEPPGTPPREGQLVFDLIVLESDHWFFGFHRHSPAHSRDPGGRPLILLPVEAPSRAYLKLEEALRWSALEPALGERALEIGSSPGGATYALLGRGLDVIGVDPAAMDPIFARVGKGHFQHIRKGVADVARGELAAPIHWILLDMNVPPQIAFEALERIWPLCSHDAVGVVLTLKLNRWRIAAEIPEFLARAQKLGLERVAATHLPSNRQEFCLVGLTRVGLSRAGSGPLRS